MSHFYSIIKGSKGEGTRCGTKQSGITATVMNHNYKVVTALIHEQGEDFLRVMIMNLRTGKYYHIVEDSSLTKFGV